MRKYRNQKEKLFKNISKFVDECYDDLVSNQIQGIFSVFFFNRGIKAQKKSHLFERKSVFEILFEKCIMH